MIEEARKLSVQEQMLIGKIDDAIGLADALKSMRQVLHHDEVISLQRWTVRWREVKRKIMRGGIDD